MIKKIKIKTKRTKHGKPVYVSEKSHFNSDTETYVSNDGENRHSMKHKILDEDMVSFAKKTVQCLQKLHFE